MATYKIDPAHSEITFKIKHLMITNVSGNFSKFDATMDSTAEDFSDASISFEADVNSISTNNEQRDTHLKSADFFHAEQFPKITFKSTAFEKDDDNKYKMKGDLTIFGITKPVSLNVEHGGNVIDPWGQKKRDLKLMAKLNEAILV